MQCSVSHSTYRFAMYSFEYVTDANLCMQNNMKLWICPSNRLKCSLHLHGETRSKLVISFVMLFASNRRREHKNEYIESTVAALKYTVSNPKIKNKYMAAYQPLDMVAAFVLVFPFPLYSCKWHTSCPLVLTFISLLFL